MPAPQPFDVVRKAVASPGAADLADPILRRDLGDLTSRVKSLNARGSDYAKIGVSNDVITLLARLEAGATLSRLVH